MRWLGGASGCGLCFVLSCGAGTLSDGQVSHTNSLGARIEEVADGPPAGDTEVAVASGSLGVGDRVSCNWKAGGTFYDGRVGELRSGGRVFISYDDGDVEETTPDMCRLVAKAGPPPPPTAGFAVGARVSCNWQAGGTFYPGRVAELRAGGRVFIQYDDGDVEETTPTMCQAPNTVGGVPKGGFVAGDRVGCNWKAGGTFYSGRVAELRPRGRIFIQYDDGDVEETTPTMCRSLATR